MPDALTLPGGTWQPTAKQAAVIRYYAAPPWPPYNEAARQAGVAIQTAKGWKDPGRHTGARHFVALLETERQLALAEHLEDLRARLADTSTRALAVIDRLLESDEERTALRAAIWTLDQTIGKAPETHHHEGTVHFVLSPGDGHADD